MRKTHDSKRLLLRGALMMSALAAGTLESAHAAEPLAAPDFTQFQLYPTLIGGHAADAEVTARAAISDANTARVGSKAGENAGESAAVFVFKLPELQPNQTIADAALWFSLREKAGSEPGAVDLYGVGTGAAPDVAPNALSGARPVLLQSDILSKTTPVGRIPTTFRGGQALAAYLQGLYGAGAKGGQYVFLRLGARGDGDNRGFDVATANDTALAPTLRISLDARAGAPRRALPSYDLPMASYSARAADALLESMGVTTHINYIQDEAEYQEKIRPALLDLGIRYLRDGGIRPDFVRRINELAQHGIRSTMVIWPEKGQEPKNLIDSMIVPMLDSIVAVEGNNEPDSEWPRFKRTYQGLGYPEGARLFQNQLYDAVKTHPNPRVRAIEVLSTSIAQPQSRAALMGPVRADKGNLHIYQGGQLPDDQMDTKWLPGARPNTGDKPIVVTESGYHYSPNMAGQPGVSERAAARYQTRIYLDFFNRGIERTHVYNLSTDRWGLIREDGTRRAGFYAIRNLIRVLQDPGVPFTPAALRFGLSGETANVRHLLLQKRDGRFYLVLWQNAFSYDTKSKQDLLTPPQKVMLRLDTPMTKAQLFRPLSTELPVRELTNAAGQIEVEVPDHPIIIELTPRVAP